MPANRRAAFVRRDVAAEGNGFGNRFDGREIYAYDERFRRHDFGGDLEPGARRGAEVDEAARILEESELFVELDEFEGGAGAVPFFFGQVVVFVQTPFGRFLVLAHFVGGGVAVCVLEVKATVTVTAEI